MKPKLLLAIFALLGILHFFAPVASAHEAYVLEPQEIAHGKSVLGGLSFNHIIHEPGNITISIVIGVLVAIALLVAVRVRFSEWGRRVDARLKSFARIAPIIVRLALAASLFESASSNSFLAPELSLSSMPYGGLIRIVLYALSFLFLTGLFTEAAALVALVIFGVGTYVFGWYMLTYSNYLGEIVVLVFAGSRFLSLDAYIFGPLRKFIKVEEYSTAIVRIGYGFALLFTAITVKVLHPLLTLAVVNKYHLTKYHLLFPHDPQLVVLGSAIVEIVIALFIMFGFQVRLTVLITLFYLTLSILFFKEAVWPHYMLYGISINLLFHEGGKLTIDGWLDKRLWRKPGLERRAASLEPAQG